VRPRKRRATPPRDSRLARLFPASALGSAAISLLLTVPLGFGPALLGAQALTNHGWGLFVALPFTLGFASAVIYGMRQPRSLASRVWVTGLSTMLLGAALLALAFEGVFCLLMAAPLALPLAAFAGACASRAEAPAVRYRGPDFTLDPACLCSWCRMGRAFHPNATPQICSEIPPPAEWIFRAGIAYPVRAEMRAVVRAQSGIACSPRVHSLNRSKFGTSPTASNFP
jgi:hypothetical protein